VRPLLALLLVVPVAVAAIRGRRLLTYGVAVFSAALFSLLSPPIGSFRVNIRDDLIALVMFVGVAFIVGTVVSVRIELLAGVERQRSALLRSVSHDLRTPLAVIEAATTALQSTERDDASARMLELVSDEARRLDRLVANLLSLSRIDAGALVVDRREIDVGELIETCAARLHRLFVTTSLTLDLADELPIIHADYALLDQVVTNLVENAARHAGNVTVSAQRVDARVVINVDDDGPGVPPADRATIFTPFRDSGTAGIGLAICKAVADAHAGSIAVTESTAGGARFTVELPVA
jgi:two-component system sensor histidine kinase KdpD